MKAFLKRWPHLKQDRRVVIAAWLMLAVGLVILPFIVNASLGGSWVRILNYTLLWLMLGLGLNIVVGYAGLLDLGYIAFYALGAYVFALLASPQLGLHLPFWAILPLGALFAGFFGVLLGVTTLKLRGDYLAIVTLGFAEIVNIFLTNLKITNGPQGVNLIDPIRIGGFDFHQKHEILGLVIPSSHFYYYLFLVFALGIMFVCIRLQESRIGRAWVAIREDEVAATAMGINTRNIKLLAFALGAMIGAIGGGLFAGFEGFISPTSFTLNQSIFVLCIVVLGGMGNIYGVILGAVLLSTYPELLRYMRELQEWIFGRMLFDPNDYRMLIFGLALVLMMILRPEGILPSKRRARELHTTPTIAAQEQATIYDTQKS